MPDYLLEIGTEELPASYIADAASSLRNLLAEALRNANLHFKETVAFSTPRRIAVIDLGTLRGGLGRLVVGTQGSH